MKEIIILTGASCSGKSTLLNRLLNRGFNILPIYTTRERREDDIEYIFISDSEMDAIIERDSTLHISFPNIGRYAYLDRDSIISLKGERFILTISDLKLAEEYKSTIKSGNIKVYILPIKRDKIEIIKCLKDRGYSIDEIKHRLKDNNRYGIDIEIINLLLDN